MARRNPRHRDHGVELKHDVADLARMLGTEPEEAGGVLLAMACAGCLDLHHDASWLEGRALTRFTVARFDAEWVYRIMRDGERFQELQDILGIQPGDDE
jgi:hypothetical protein